MLIVLIVILAKACGGGGAVQPKPHKTKVHKTAAVSASPSASRFHVAVSAAQVAQGGTAQVDYRIGGPAGAKGNVKIVVKNMAGKGVAFFTVAGRQPTGQALVYRFLAVLDPGTYSCSVQVNLSTGATASGSGRLVIVASAAATPSPAST